MTKVTLSSYLEVCSLSQHLNDNLYIAMMIGIWYSKLISFLPSFFFFFEILFFVSNESSGEFVSLIAIDSMFLLIIRSLNSTFDAGKFIISYTPSCGEKEYYLASACEEIYAPPSAYVSLYGLAVQASFLRGQLIPSFSVFCMSYKHVLFFKCVLSVLMSIFFLVLSFGMQISTSH